MSCRAPRERAAMKYAVHCTSAAMKCVVLPKCRDEMRTLAICNRTLLARFPSILILEKTLDRFGGVLGHESAGCSFFSSRNRSFACCDRFGKRERFDSFAPSIRAHSANQSDGNTGCRSDAQHCEECVVIDWREVDGQLRTLAMRRAALDAEEARLLREAERLQLWRQLGMVSALDYMERVLGYAPHTAMERLRIARALASLPVIEGALAGGQLNFSAVRELTRVATPSTEARWCERAIGKNVRQIEDLVAGHAPGSDPDDPADPATQRHKVTLDLSAEVFARWRQAQTIVADERGGRADDDAFVTELVEARLERGAGEPTGRAKYQIMMTLCAACERGWQEGSGRQIPVDAATVERAKCDAQYIGSTDDEQPVRATQDVPPSVARFVFRRDGGKCQTPGCRSARGLEVHHIVPRADGGTHAPDNLRLQCSACHSALHRGTLEIVDGEARRPNEPLPAPTSPVGSDMPTAFDIAAARSQARDALTTLGWKPAIARAAVDDAISHVGGAPLEVLIREALRRCPRPSS